MDRQTNKQTNVKQGNDFAQKILRGQKEKEEKK